MIEPQSYARLKQEIVTSISSDRGLLEQLRNEIRPLRNDVHPIYTRNATSMSLVATDGGNISLQFDPFLVQIIRIVDSSNREYCLEAVTPSTSISALSAKQFHADGSPRTALGAMMAYLEVRDLHRLSPRFPNNEHGRPISSSWVKVYRELVEWASLFSIVRTNDFAGDTLIIVDGLLRSVVFGRDLFHRYWQGINEGIELQKEQKRRKIYLAGVAKHSKVLSRYRLAISLENILTCNYPAYVLVPRDIEEKAYTWAEYARGEGGMQEGPSTQKYVGGKMYFVKFGNRSRDPIWPIDIYLPQVPQVSHILGCMLNDAINGFPIPHYPLCLQKAHANAALVDFDFDILQNHIFDGIRHILADEAAALDMYRLQDSDPSERRYE